MCEKNTVFWSVFKALLWASVASSPNLLRFAAVLLFRLLPSRYRLISLLEFFKLSNLWNNFLYRQWTPQKREKKKPRARYQCHIVTERNFANAFQKYIENDLFFKIVRSTNFRRKKPIERYASENKRWTTISITINTTRRTLWLKIKLDKKIILNVYQTKSNIFPSLRKSHGRCNPRGDFIPFGFSLIVMFRWHLTLSLIYY